MSNHIEKQKVAYVAIKRHKGGGATFAYLPSQDIQLPSGWERSVITDENGQRVVDTEDISHWLDRGMTVDQTCRMMSAHTGLKWEEE